MFTVLVPLFHMTGQTESAGYGPPHAILGFAEVPGYGRERWQIFTGHDDILLREDMAWPTNLRWDIGHWGAR